MQIDGKTLTPAGRMSRAALWIARAIVTLLISPKGRIGRRSFWVGFAIVIVLSLVLGALGPVGRLTAFLLIWPQICVHGKRLHDMNRTAWLMIIPLLVTIASPIAAAQVGGPPLVMALANNDNAALVHLARDRPAVVLIALAPVLFGAGFALWVGFTRGNTGPNRFGPAPMWWSKVESKLVHLGLRRDLQVR
jgi:uncharacterized membrane protein YhaH (DUF805 family)